MPGPKGVPRADIVAALLDRDIPVAVISPTARAKYATGSGAARKTAVLEAAQRRYGALLESDDEADALILRAMGSTGSGSPSPRFRPGIVPRWPAASGPTARR